MSSGFNTVVHVGDDAYHVQTEDRGPHHPVIDTALYQRGRVLHHIVSNYGEFAASPEFSTEGLRERVEAQHRLVIDELRAGKYAAEIAAAAAQQIVHDAGIRVQLLNPQSWLSAGNVSLDVEILRRADHQPQVGAHIEAAIEGALENTHYTGTSDDRGRAKIEFPLPPLGKGDLALVIHAKADAAKDEIRFTMRSRSKAPASGSVPGS